MEEKSITITMKEYNALYRAYFKSVEEHVTQKNGVYVCHDCGKRVKPKHSFCKNCGKKLGW